MNAPRGGKDRMARLNHCRVMAGVRPPRLARVALALALALVLSARPAGAFDPLTGDLSKENPLDVRVVAYNHNQYFLQNSSRDAAFNRILIALAPDVICFEEFTSGVSTQDVANRLNTILPLPSGGWQIHFGLLAGVRTALASRYPLTQTRTDTIPPSATRGVTIARVNLPDADYPVDLYLLGVHLKCCGNPGGSEDASRQDSADAIANWLGDARGVARPSGDNVSLPADTPMIALGDFNFVGGPQPENTLVTGNIQDQGFYGPDVKGDWDNSNLADLTPADPFTGDTFTWQGNSSFPPSRLDRFFYTDSALVVAHGFVLNTDTMPPQALSAAGLQAGDTLPSSSSDHLPVIADLRVAFQPAIPGDFDGDGDVDIDDFGVFQACATGAGLGPPPPGCDDKRLDADDDIDLSDFGIFQRCLTGPDVPGDANCAG